MPRLALFSLLLAAAACSQRSPWVPVPPPTRGAEPTRPKQPETRQEGTALNVALATMARADATLVASVGGLYFPVAGFEGRPLDNSYDDPRDGGNRRHHAIDIMAPRGTPVLSVQDGRILRLSRNSKGGITVYATDPEERFVFYYAHLDRYHPGIREGLTLMRGDTIGYVGTTGNAPDTVPHLHFQLMRMPADRRYWNGEPINPYPLLRAPTPDTAPDSSSK
jgi:murein DD-endopeptidase MepM/ murein hydrolase activator NlpD